MAKIIDLLTEDEKKKERILHIIKRIETLRRQLGKAIAELASETGMMIK